VSVLQKLLPVLHLPAEVHHLLEHERILLRDAVARVHPAEHVVKTRRPEQHRQAGVLVTGGIDVDEARRELRLRVHEALLRHRERVGVVRQVVLDPGELDVGEVVGLDGPLEARVELLDL
jgi:hypothetical protein